jgi:hypothetical protein
MRQRGYNKMSLCYDFQKWTMIMLASVAISLTIGLLMQYAHGANSLEELKNQVENPVIDKYRQELINYIIEHGWTNSMTLKTFGDTTFKKDESYKISAYYRNGTTLLGPLSIIAAKIGCLGLNSLTTCCAISSVRTVPCASRIA